VLNAVIHGKAGRVNVGDKTENVSWRQLFQQREDLLTAAFFSRFGYLSPVIQHRLLQYWFGGEGDFTTYKGMEFWPKYELQNNDVRDFVEPDLLINFSHFDVMIEVKPPQGGDQYFEQWETEIDGYFSLENNSKPLWFIAVGRIEIVPEEWSDKLTKNEQFNLQKIAAIKWKPIASHISKLIKSGEPHYQDHRILEDMLRALSLYGIRGHDLYWKDLYKIKGYSGDISSLFKLWHLRI